MTSLAAAQYLRLRRQCDANHPGLRLRLLRALAIARPEYRYD